MAVEIKQGKNTRGKEMIWVNCPYAPNLPALFRELGGIWKSETKQWVFDARDLARVQNILSKTFGTDGTNEAGERVTVTVRPGLNGQNWVGDPLWLFGRCLVERRSRDERVRLGEDVVVVKGHFASSGGSRNNPAINASEDVVLEVRDVPKALAEKAAERYPRAVQLGVYREENDEVFA